MFFLKDFIQSLINNGACIHVLLTIDDNKTKFNFKKGNRDLMETSNDQKVWKQVRIKTGERLNLNIAYFSLNEQTRIVKDEY